MAKRLSQPEVRLQGTGTVFKLTGLHDDWSEDMQNKVRRHLENLLPPAAVGNFEIYFFNEETGRNLLKSIATVLNSSTIKYHFKFRMIRSIMAAS